MAILHAHDKKINGNRKYVRDNNQRKWNMYIWILHVLFFKKLCSKFDEKFCTLFFHELILYQNMVILDAHDENMNGNGEDV